MGRTWHRELRGLRERLVSPSVRARLSADSPVLAAALSKARRTRAKKKGRG